MENIILQRYSENINHYFDVRNKIRYCHNDRHLKIYQNVSNQIFGACKELETIAEQLNLTFKINQIYYAARDKQR